MKYTILGKTGVLVSELCGGTMSFGGQADEKESARMFARYRDMGINFFDCANAYNNGKSEEILGNLIKDCRDEVVITTKATNRVGQDVNAIGSSRRHIMMEIEKSLRRLGTDRIDLFFIHIFDELTPIEETLRTLDDLIRQGKVLYIGVSNWAAWQVAKALGISAKEGLARFECIQPMYNLLKRQAEVELFPLSKAENMGVIVYSPMAAGLLSGKYVGGKMPSQGRIAENEQYGKRYGNPIYYEISGRFSDYAKEKNIHPVTLAIAWVKAHPVVTAPIIAARNVEQLEASLDAADFDMTSEMWKEISALSIQPASATDRLEETIDTKFMFRNT